MGSICTFYCDFCLTKTELCFILRFSSSKLQKDLTLCKKCGDKVYSKIKCIYDEVRPEIEGDTDIEKDFLKIHGKETDIF